MEWTDSQVAEAFQGMCLQDPQQVQDQVSSSPPRRLPALAASGSLANEEPGAPPLALEGEATPAALRVDVVGHEGETAPAVPAVPVTSTVHDGSDSQLVEPAEPFTSTMPAEGDGEPSQAVDGDDGKPKEECPSTMGQEAGIKPEKPPGDEELEELPMVTREQQVAFKGAKAAAKKMDDAAEVAPLPKESKAKANARKRTAPVAVAPVLKRPAAASSKGAKLAQPVEPAEAEEAEEVESDGPRENLSPKFEEVASDVEEVPAAAWKEPAKEPAKARVRKQKEAAQLEEQPRPKKQKSDKKDDKATKESKEAEGRPKPAGSENPPKKATFAGRACPTKNELAKTRFQVIRKVFEEQIGVKITSGSASSAEARSNFYLSAQKIPKSLWVKPCGKLLLSILGCCMASFGFTFFFRKT